MKTMAQIEGLLETWHKKTWLPVTDLTQRSEAWLNMRLGVLTASNASKIVAKEESATRATYMAELVAEVCTARYEEEMNFKAIKHGRDNEDAARQFYAFESNREVMQVGFVFKDDSFRVGCSPDAVFLDPTKQFLAGGAEFKCPWDSANFIKFALGGDVKKDWDWQNQFTIWVMETKGWDMCFYDPRMVNIPKLHREAFARDEKKQQTLDEKIPRFIYDMDSMLKELGVSFGDHWKAIREQNQIEKKASA